MRRCVRTSAALLAFLLAAPSCADRREVPGDSAAPRAAAPRTAAELEAEFRRRLDHTWELARLGTQEIPPPPDTTPPDAPGRDLVPGRRPTLRFSLDAAGAGAGGRSFCNGYGGPFEVRGDSLHIREIVSTAVGCDSADSLETRFFRGLRTTRRYALAGDSLTLIGEDGASLLLFVSPSR